MRSLEISHFVCTSNHLYALRAQAGACESSFSVEDTKKMKTDTVDKLKHQPLNAQFRSQQLWSFRLLKRYPNRKSSLLM